MSRAIYGMYGMYACARVTRAGSGDEIEIKAKLALRGILWFAQRSMCH